MSFKDADVLCYSFIKKTIKLVNLFFNIITYVNNTKYKILHPIKNTINHLFLKNKKEILVLSGRHKG